MFSARHRGVSAFTSSAEFAKQRRMPGRHLKAWAKQRKTVEQFVHDTSLWTTSYDVCIYIYIYYHMQMQLYFIYNMQLYDIM